MRMQACIAKLSSNYAVCQSRRAKERERFCPQTTAPLPAMGDLVRQFVAVESTVRNEVNWFALRRSRDFKDARAGKRAFGR